MDVILNIKLNERENQTQMARGIMKKILPIIKIKLQIIIQIFLKNNKLAEKNKILNKMK